MLLQPSARRLCCRPLLIAAHSCDWLRQSQLPATAASWHPSPHLLQGHACQEGGVVQMILRVQQQLRGTRPLLSVHVGAGRDDAAWQPHQAFHLQGSRQSAAGRGAGRVGSSCRSGSSWPSAGIHTLCRAGTRHHAEQQQPAAAAAAAAPAHPQAALLRGVAKKAPAAGTSGVDCQAAGACHRYVTAVLADGRVQLQGEEAGGTREGRWAGREGGGRGEARRIHAGSSEELQQHGSSKHTSSAAVQQYSPVGRRPRCTAAAA